MAQQWSNLQANILEFGSEFADRTNPDKRHVQIEVSNSKMAFTGKGDNSYVTLSGLKTVDTNSDDYDAANKKYVDDQISNRATACNDAVAAERTRAQGKEQVNADAIAAEISRATGKEQENLTKIENLIGNGGVLSNTHFNGNLNAKFGEIKTAIDGAKSAADDDLTAFIGGDNAEFKQQGATNFNAEMAAIDTRLDDFNTHISGAHTDLTNNFNAHVITHNNLQSEFDSHKSQVADKQLAQDKRVNLLIAGNAESTGATLNTPNVQGDGLNGKLENLHTRLEAIHTKYDGKLQGLSVKKSVLVAVDLAPGADPKTLYKATFANGAWTYPEIQGQRLKKDSRFMVKGDGNKKHNGIYMYKKEANGELVNPCEIVRAEDMDQLPSGQQEIAGAFCFVEAGTYANQGWVVMTPESNEDFVVGTNDIEWSQFSGAGQITFGHGLDSQDDTVNLKLDAQELEIDGEQKLSLAKAFSKADFTQITMQSTQAISLKSSAKAMILEGATAEGVLLKCGSEDIVSFRDDIENGHGMDMGSSGAFTAKHSGSDNLIVKKDGDGSIVLTVKDGQALEIAKDKKATFAGAVKCESGLEVSGTLLATNTLTVTEQTTCNGGLNVSGATFCDALVAKQNVICRDTLTVAEAATFQKKATCKAALDVEGLATCKAGLTVSSGDTNCVKLTASNAVACQDTLAVTKAATFDDTVTIKGKATCEAALDVEGLATCKNGLTVSSGDTNCAKLTAGDISCTKLVVDLGQLTLDDRTLKCDEDLNLDVGSGKQIVLQDDGNTYASFQKGSEKFELKVDGNQILTVNGDKRSKFTGVIECQSCFCISDERLKKNIHTIGNVLDIVKDEKFRGVSWEWKDESKNSKNKEESIKRGCVAQEIQALIPGAVATDEKGNLAVDYNSITGVLMSAVKELALKVEQLQN